MCCVVLWRQVEFLLQDAGYIRYYLAPKIDDDEGDDAGMADAE